MKKNGGKKKKKDPETNEREREIIYNGTCEAACGKIAHFVQLELTDDTAWLKDLFIIFWVGDFCTALFVFFLILAAGTSPLSFWTPPICL